MSEQNHEEMSVDELLQKLRASVMADAPETSEAPQAPEAPEVPEEASEASDGDALVAPECPEAFDTPEYNAPEAEVQSEEPPAAEPSAYSAPIINEDDIFAAWGISKEEAVAAKPEEPEEAEKPMPEEMSAAQETPAFSQIFRIARVEKKEAYLARKSGAEPEAEGARERTDAKYIKHALGMEALPEGESDLPQPSGNEAAHTVVSEEEFTYQRQSADIAQSYRRKRRTSVWKLVLTAVCAVLLFCVECLPTLGIRMPEVLRADGDYSLVYAMFALQMLWFAAALSHREIASGFAALKKGGITPGGILLFAVVLTTVCDIAYCFTDAAATFNFPALFCALLIRIFAHMDICREIASFEIASAPEAKYVVSPVSADEKEKLAETGLEMYADADAKIFRTERCTFVENYFARTEKLCETDTGVNRYLVPVILALSLLAAIVAAARSHSTAAAFGAFNGIMLIGLPTCISLSAVYPFYKAVKRLFANNSTIIGENAAEEYAGTTMICFDDADAFPCIGVSLKTMRIYGDSDIHTVLEQMGAIFRKIGGPLRFVFTPMTAECPKPYKVKITSILENGICADVNGCTLMVGTASFMAENGIPVAAVSATEDGRISTMYLAGEGVLRAKFDLQYALDGGFEAIVKRLARQGIASVILTGDPNINDELLAGCIELSKLPCKVVRRSLSDKSGAVERAESGAVSRGGIGSLADAVTMCDRLSAITSTMRAVRVASVAICAALTLFAGITNLFGAISSLYITLYQLLWLIPAWLVVKVKI